VEWDNPMGRKKALSLRDALKAALTYSKSNITGEVLADVFGVSQSTISRHVQLLTPNAHRMTADSVPEVDELPSEDAAIIDGSLFPCWSWAGHAELWSDKHKTTRHNHQFPVSLSGRLPMVFDQMPGSAHDAKATAVLREAFGDDFPANLVGDMGYIGTGAITPFRKPPGGELAEWQKESNRSIDKIRYAVERAIANFKIWRVLFTDYRWPLHTHTETFNMIRALYFYNESFA
jgi:hypothetical protein